MEIGRKNITLKSTITALVRNYEFNLFMVAQFYIYLIILEKGPNFNGVFLEPVAGNTIN